MRRYLKIVATLLAASVSLAGCDKARPTRPTPSGPGGCLGCHGGIDDSSGAPPYDLAGSATGGGVGAHTAHLGHRVACEECHVVPGRIADRGHIVKPDGSPDGDGRAEVTFGARATKSGSFSASYAPAPAPGKGGTCTVYCHGASLGAAAGSNTSPAWGGPPMNCGSCHGTSVAGAPPNHTPGLTTADCATCHPETVTPGGQITTTGTHINGRVEVKGCTGCHGDDARGEPVPEAAWAPPKDTQGATAGARVGAHLRHVSGVAGLGSRLSRPFACSECHLVPTNAGPHGQAVIQWPAPGSNGLSNLNGALSPSYAGGRCDATYCHGSSLHGGSNTSPSWNAAGTVTCGSCHFVASPPAPHPATDHAGVAITAAAQCAQCHPGTVNPDGTINVVNGMHVDGLVEVDFHPAGYSNPAAHGPDALRNLSNAGGCKSCHGPTFAGQGPAPSCTQCHASAGHATWLTECTFCHGQGNRAADAAFALVGNPPVAANKAAPPVGTQGETGTNQPAVGAHLAHLQPSSSLNGALAIQIQCTECHGLVLPTDEKHADGSVAIGWGPLATRNGTVVPAPAAGNLVAGWEAAPTCTNYCHGITLAGGAKVNPSWVAGAPEAACGTCHAARPGTWHPNNGGCGQCHPGYTSSSVNVTTHVNGTVEPPGTSCTSCHGGQSGNPAPPYASTGATSGVKVGAHQAHVNAANLVGAGYACAVCHPNQTQNRHANDQVDMAWTFPAMAGGVVPTPLAGPLATAAWETPPNSTCTNYCHGAGLASNAVTPAPLWTAAAGSLACTSCHGAPPPLSARTGQDHPQNPACASCHGAGYALTGLSSAARLTHVDGLVTRTTSGCTACHGELGATGTTIAVPLKAAPGASGSGTNSFDTTGLATGNVIGAHKAHLVGSTGTPRWRSAALACVECHPMPASDADVSHATGVGTGGARANVIFVGPLGGSSAFGARTAAYANSTTAAGGTVGGSCASTYCHAPRADTVAGINQRPAWSGAPSTVACGSCHGLPPTANNHTSSTSCSGCHPGYADAPTSASSLAAVNAIVHMDGKLDYDAAGASCTTCHGDPNRTVVSSATDLDGQTPSRPLALAAPPWDLARNPSTSPQIGAHLAHVNQGATGTPLSSAQHCVACHVVPTSPSHSNGVTTVTFGDIAGLTASYDPVNHGCSSTYCHGQFPGGNGANTIGWGTGSTAGTKLGCGSCHPSPPARPHPGNPTCASCHTGYGATTVTAASHVDGKVDKSTSGCTSCHGELTASGVTVSPPNNLVAAAPGATGTSTVDTVGQTLATSAGVGAHRAHLGAGVIGHVAIACTECHPVPTSNTDVAHASGGTGTGGARANVLFGATATGAVNAWSGAPVSPTYLNSTSATGGTAGGSCASTYCHGNFRNGTHAVLTWTTVGAMTCSSCHGLPPAGSHPTLQAGDACGSCHPGYTGTVGGSSWGVNASTHLNGKLETGHPAGWLNPDQHATGPDGALVAGLSSCTACHTAYGSPIGGPPRASCDTCHATPSAYGPYTAGVFPDHLDWKTECTFCHGGRDNTTGAPARTTSVISLDLTTPQPTTSSRIGAHTSHVGSPGAPARSRHGLSASIGCAACHATMPADLTHVNGSVALGFASVGTTPNPGTPYSAATGCAANYCHGNFTRSGIPGGATPLWTGSFGASATLTCASCHGQGASVPQPPHPHPQNTTCGSCHVGFTATTLTAAAATTHVDGTVNRSTSGCTSCHGELPAAGVTLTANLVAAAPGATGTNTVDTTGQAAATSAGVGAHRAHLVGAGGTPRWRSSAIACTECHALPPSNTDVAHATGSGTGGARANVLFGALASSAVLDARVPIYGGSTTGSGGIAGGSCGSTYCHAPRADTVAGLAQAPSWTGATGTAACGSCHGLPPAAALHPASAACGSCHLGYANAPTSASTIAAVNALVHLDGKLDLVMTCTSCHGAKGTYAPISGADANAASAPPTAADGVTTTGLKIGAHQAHVNGKAGAATYRTNPVGCADCHPVPSTTTHSSGTVDAAWSALATNTIIGGATVTSPLVPGAGTNAFTAAWEATPTCTNACHGGAIPSNAPKPTPRWDGGPLGCTSCHGAPPPLSASAPNQNHPQNPSCGACHGAGYSATSVAKATHIDGTLNLITSGCTACHGELGAPGVTLTASLVRSAPGASGSGTNSVDSTGLATGTVIGAHQAHLVGSGGTPRWRSTAIACTECHPLPASNTDVSHATGAGTGGARANVLFGALATSTSFETKTPGYAQPTCSSVYCHDPRSSDTALGLVLAPLWTATGNVVCGSCHGLPPLTATHPANAACSQCHPSYPDNPAAGTALSAAAKLIHLNGSLDGGESSGGSPCLNCHKTDAATGAAYGKMVSDTTLYHHVVAEGAAFRTYPTTAGGQACLQCHADHDVFNPTLNPANTLGRGANLRTTIATAPTKVAPATGNYASTDFSGSAGICLSCHAASLAKAAGQRSDGSTATHPVDGAGFSASAHAYAVAGSIRSGPSAFSAICMKCHSDAPVGTTYPEKQNGTWEFALHTSIDRRLRNPMGQVTPTDDRGEDHCFRCHSVTTDTSPGGGPAKAVANRDYFNATAMSAASQDVFQAFTNTLHTSKHNVAGYDQVHQPTEAPAGAGGTKHVECEDCHEPHAARAGAKPANNSNLVWGPLTGVTGVVPTWSAASWTAPTAYAATTASTTEYQICFKCHSGANAGLATWGAGDWTDVALEFSPANQSRHPVASALPATDPGVNGSSQLPNAGQLINGWVKGMVMTCSDCHGADAASPAAQGPHGSAVRYMLKGTNRAWPFTVAGVTTGTLRTMTNATTGTAAGFGTANGLFCRNCHPDPAGATGTTNAGHIQFRGQHGGNAISTCVRCHLRVPHGGKVSRLIATSPNTPARYQVSGQTLNLVHFVKNNAGTYSGSSWFGTTCSTHSGGAAAGEAW